MFLHLGGEVVVPIAQIVAIIDLEARDNSESTEEFLSVANDEGFMVHLSDNPNSFVVTTEKIYLSPISALTLRKRAQIFTRKPKDLLQGVVIEKLDDGISSD